MKPAYAAFAIMLMSCAPVAMADNGKTECSVSEADFIGSWSSPVGGEIVKNDTHVIEFAKVGGKNIFSSWLHYRPNSVNLEWRFENCRAIISGGSFVTKYSFATDGTNRLIQQPIFSNAPIYTRVE